MYDRSLDLFGTHSYPELSSLYPVKTGLNFLTTSVGYRSFSDLGRDWYILPPEPAWGPDRFIFFDSYYVGGLGTRYYANGAGAIPEPTMTMPETAAAPPEEKAIAMPPPAPQAVQVATKTTSAEPDQTKAATQPTETRTNFEETAFFKPHLLTDADGNVQIEFQIPDSVTSWNLYIHAMTKDLMFMVEKREVITQKSLMVRPYMPRFFREGDAATLKVMVNNATDEAMEGVVTLRIFDPDTNQDKTQDFGVQLTEQPWKMAGKGSTTLSWDLLVPYKLGGCAFEVIAKSENYQDGEIRPVPILPSRIHLVQSKFITLKDQQTKTMMIKDLEDSVNDPTLIHQSMVVSLDAQLIYSVIQALPYLTQYPYECVEQTLNRFLSTGIVSSMYERYPSIAKMAKEMSKRETQLQPWRKQDVNRAMALEETPWLQLAEGGEQDMSRLINVLDPQIAKAHREDSLEKLRKAQYSNGAFPWWAGGPPSPYITLYLLAGFGKALEFKVAIPEDMCQKAWSYLGSHFQEEYQGKDWEKIVAYPFLTYLNYVLSCYPESYYSSAFSKEWRIEIANHCFSHWKELCPYLKAYLALTLKRMNRDQDAKLVMESIMDSAITKEDQGTFWVPEDRSWLWYNDTIESHAFVLRTLQEVMPENKEQLDGLVLWLLLNKKCNQWKSTRATSEVVYSLVYTMDRQGSLGQRETAKILIGPKQYDLVFEPDQYTGEHQQFIIPGTDIIPQTMSKVQVSKTGPGYMFASMVWHYSTEKLPQEERGDFLSVSRSYYLRQHQGSEYVLKPLAEGTPIAVGDQVEVHLSITSKHPMEYVHLRDPRGAGFEPETLTSGHHWDLGICWYEEVRDSGTNFFFEYLPQGEYPFKYRIRANMAGEFRIGPATIQGMYAPEFAAFSKGHVITIK